MDPTESFIESVHRPEGECSVEELALLIAAHRRPGLDIPSTLGRLDDLAARVVLGDLESLRSVLFVESGFRGNTEDYYDADNSMLDVVISRRTGIPISLSILTIAVGRRAGIDLVGIGMPGHFLVRSGSDSSLFLDPFGGGAVLDRQRCVDLFHLSQGAAARLGPEHLEPVGTFAIIERELGGRVEDLYAEFDPAPIAAASLGQVYRARLATGEDVAVKVQRPRLDETINFDLAVLRRMARFLNRYPKLVRGVDWEATLNEFATVIFEEMDYVQEGRNADLFRSNFRDWAEVHVPAIHWKLSSPRVLTMEFIEGTKLLDLAGLRARGIDPPVVVRLVARTYLKQLLEDGYFHADPHPGNLRVMPDGRLAFFDFG
ncbi:MAG: hypothetical protein EBX39_09635, partial [Actinobacteria bacterium]|nr:hypothetical protein [Actinomycetota bacterium]